MEICVLGLNHKTAPVELRERLAMPNGRAEQVLKELESRRIFEERVILSTCNRLEIYGVCRTQGSSINGVKDYLSEYSRLERAHLEPSLYVLRQPESVDHLFRVASGLDSMVIGETEILGQVKEAYLAAHRSRQTGKVLNNLFQRSLKVAKALRTHTVIGSGRVGVASITVDLAEKIFENLKGARATVLGTGEMAGQLLRALVSRGADATVVSLTSPERALELASAVGGKAASAGDLQAIARHTDILITSTGCTNPVVTEAGVREWMRSRHENPLFIIDIALPRNVDSAVQRIDNVYLYDLDDLKAIADKNLALRGSQMEECAALVARQTEHYMGWLAKEFGSAGCPAEARPA
ncbi:MAG: Glutamyl-tRNA reductase [Candidatus Omnitrophica bacterium]|nr:Glutamyl-tRNA reductase [Candidatus Omnitrophota bacterium]